MYRYIVLFALLLCSLANAQEDLITELVLERDPKTPGQFLQVLEDAGHKVRTHMVANRGALNHSGGSFSVFGDVGPELTFGIFVEPDQQGHLVLQESFDVRLLIEVITQDKSTGLHNFWELIGDGETADWHYRGNSLDVIADAEEINMGPTDTPLFGKRLRCSGCHTGGGLVMKERFPYNDWRNEEALPTGKWINSPRVSEFAERSESASHLDDLVQKSLNTYVETLEERSPETSKQWLRSVLAPLEMNLVSDTRPYLVRITEGSDIEIPADFFVDSRLSGPLEPVRVPAEVYRQALQQLGSSFAQDETPGLEETQHAFLVPTVSRFDRLRTESLLKRGLIDEELLSDLLAVDFTTPLYSQERLSLMYLLPQDWNTTNELREHLESQLRSRRATDEATARLADFILDSRFDASHHRRRAIAFVDSCRRSADQVGTVKEWLRLAAQRRVEIQAAQTSSNPRGSILEGGLGSEGFRRIFPSYEGFEPKPYEIRLEPPAL